MNRKLKVLGILFWVQGGLYVASALLFAGVGILGGLGVIEPKDTVHERLGGAVASLLLGGGAAALGAGHLFVGTALRRLRPWARTAGLVLGVADVICCCSFPLGTALGVYTLIVLLNEDVRRLFA